MSLRLAILGSSPCERCWAACCKRTVAEYAVLLTSEAERRRFAAWSVTLPIRGDGGGIVHERVIPYRDDTGRCPFLGDDDLCSIYEDRPAACRAFECVRHHNRDGVGRHGPFLVGNPDVAAMLEAW